MKHPKLRDIRKLNTEEPYPLNEIPDSVIQRIGAGIVYLIATGRKDISGSDWGEIFAESVGGKHLDSPVGIADVVFGKMAWSLKTVKNNSPQKTQNIRLISGRCSPDYSYGITDPHEDIQMTGRAVLGIWNERINIAYDSYNPVKTAVLLRSSDLQDFCLFEEESHRFPTSDYKWETNDKGSLLGKEIETGKTKFTWQPHGSQFTIHETVPKNSIKFTIKCPSILTKEDILKHVGYDASWINIKRG